MKPTFWTHISDNFAPDKIIFLNRDFKFRTKIEKEQNTNLPIPYLAAQYIFYILLVNTYASYQPFVGGVIGWRMLGRLAA